MKFALALLLASSALSQDRARIEAYTAAHQREIMSEFAQLLSLPNIGGDKPAIARNAAFLKTMLERHGMRAQVLETTGNPVVFGELTSPGAARTVFFYIHYDGQPVDAVRWKQADPFRPVMRDKRLEEGGREIPNFTALTRFDPEARIYARSAADDKAPIASFCAMLAALRGRLRNNIKVILDGEEELGSGSLAGAMAKQKQLMSADIAFIVDGPAHASGRPTLYFGARGSTGFDLTVYGSKTAVHSGHYGNWLPNPAMRLAQLLATMKDDQGRTTVAGFHDGILPLTAADRSLLKSVPDDEPALLRLFGVSQPDRVGENLQEALQYPSLNVHSIRSGEKGGVIPTEATAKLELRLVKETPAEAQIEKVLQHIRAQGYRILDHEPTDAERAQFPKLARVERRATAGFAAWRTEPGSAAGKRVINLLRETWNADPVVIRTMGGSVPGAQIIRELGVPAVGVPVVNFDNNQHSDNENVRVGNLWSGAVTLGALAGW